MNEKLQQEITKLFNKDHSTLKSKKQYAEFAEHFYSLALEDVVEKIYTIKDNLGTSDIDIEMHGLLQEIIDTLTT